VLDGKKEDEMADKWRIVDADNHYYEPDDCFSRHIEPRFRDRCVHIVRDGAAPGRPYVGEAPMYFLVSNPADLVGRPGAVVARKDERYEPLPPEQLIRAGDVAELNDREARLHWMDAHGIDAVLLFPSLALTVEHQLRDSTQVCVANLRAFNRWLDEDWGFSYRDRIVAVPFLSLVDLDSAVLELEWVLGRGARAVHLLFSPVAGRSVADPYYDPFWARLSEAGVPVCFHGCDAGYSELFSVQWGEPPRPPAHAQSAFQRAFFYGERPIMDTLGSLVLHNLFGRFPDLQVMSIENGSAWVPYLLRVMDRAAKTGARGRWLGGPVTEAPSEIFKQHVSVAPFDDDDAATLVDLIGADRVLLGSDYPHPEGYPEPRDFFCGVPLTDDERRRIERTNAARLLGLPGA
jgi:predicted TIM-barrel fold metal-dependent hydrolase